MANSQEQDTEPDIKGTGSVKTTTVVVAVDANEHSEYALKFYAEHLHKPDNELYLVHITEQKLISSPGIVGATDMPLVTKDKKRLEDRADTLVTKLEEAMKELQVIGIIERSHGEPGPAIITLANQKKADYIVVGCRGKGAVMKTLTGSVTDYVTHHSNVPVVVARHRDHLEHFNLKSPFRRNKKGDSNNGSTHT